ncbi:DUF3397 family protein [Jeotgalibacillus haloalkalitolerans]|uniref:DUF3397 family protein n=1 Tax=Jeotgalibacillus haloalkalitolerans TaxID=3104292 RepID=A0ABU5KJX8_9BACL|nr:DUF3397 family protein [Jeotgalibacillus sp. HH7-29]MDZ5711559.1 DUF3397 family protein [Jeotgalibacillus sp. HH7-29]
MEAAAILISILLYAPYLIYLIVFIAVKKISSRHRTAVSTGIHATNPFLIGSVYFLILSIWDLSVFWLLCLIIAATGILSAIYIRSKKDDFTFAHILKSTWRLSFLIFVILHISLVIAGTALAIYHSVI